MVIAIQQGMVTDPTYAQTNHYLNIYRLQLSEPGGCSWSAALCLPITG